MSYATLKRSFLKSEPMLLDDMEGFSMSEIVPVSEFEKTLEVYKAETDKILRYAKEIEINSDEDSLFNIEEAGKWRKLSKKIEAARKEVTDPARNFINQINSLAKGYTDVLDQATKLIASKDGRYKAEKLAKIEANLEAERLLEGFFGETQKAIVVEEFKQATKTANASTYLRTDYEIVIENLSLVPVEFLVLNETEVKRAAKAGKLDIPGLKITEKKITTLKTR